MSVTGGSERTPLILVADDHEAIRLLVREALEGAGFRVVEAVDGRQAVAAFAEHRPDLILLDAIMPEMDGFETCEALRRKPGGEAVPILFVTGLDDFESIKRAFDAGASDFAAKPFNWLVLGHRVHYMLRAKRNLDDLRRSQDRLAAAQRIARLGHWERDLRTGDLTWSDEMYGLFGVDPETFRPTPEAFLARVHPEDRELVTRSTEGTLTGDLPYSFDLRTLLPDGTVRYIHEQAEVVRDEAGRAILLAGTTQDVTDRKQAEEQIRFLAYYDGLTALPNRVLFMERLRLALAVAHRQSRQLAILFLDLDRFKRINDTLGHSVGDRLLQAVAERLRRCVRSSDTVARGDASSGSDTVAPLGGDEFIISLTEVARGEDAARVAQRILDALGEPFRLDDHEIVVTSSIGISVFPHDGNNADTLLKNADAAMYHVKDSGRNGYHFYDRSMNDKALQRLSLESSLRRALERGELTLYYQPQVDAVAGAIAGAEALIRWRHPALGLVSAGDFIPLAEESDLILPIGAWVLRTACAQLRSWHDAGHSSLLMSINLSGRQFRQHDLVRVVEEAIRASRLEPRFVELEITESVLMRDVEQTIGILKQLKGMGVRISVDDFGTGHSSLSYLTRFPIDVLKIGQSFVRDVATDPGDAAITAAIVAMARDLQVGVIAEGVETGMQREYLHERGCRLMQGYLFGHPVPAEEFSRLLQERSTGGLLIHPN